MAPYSKGLIEKKKKKGVFFPWSRRLCISHSTILLYKITDMQNKDHETSKEIKMCTLCLKEKVVNENRHTDGPDVKVIRQGI